MTTYTLFQQNITASLNADTLGYTLAVQFSVTQNNLTLTSIWWYSAPTVTVLPTTIALYTSSGTLVASQTPTWSGAAGSGWVSANFTTPPALLTGTNYYGCVFYGGGSPWYTSIDNYWSTGPGANGITNGPLTAPNSNNSVVGQDPFSPVSTGVHVPTQSNTSRNYLVDVAVTTTGGTPPAVVTNAATGVTSSSATLNGTVNPESLATTYQFNWGLTTSYGNSTASASAGSGAVPVAETASLTGLLANTTYHYQIQATNSAGTSFGADQTFTTLTSGSLVITNVVAGNVVNDYGLDNVPYTVSSTGATTMLAAYIGWDVAQQAYQSTGKAPAVNVTDSAGNLWQQVGISTVSTASRGALWVCDNPRQTSWVSVALTGWGQSTSYMICELDNVPSSLGAVSLDFVKTVNSTAFTTTQTLSATANTTDIVLGLTTTGGNGGSLTVPTGWSGISSVGGVTAVDATTYAMWIPTQTAGAVPTFNPTWSNSVPSSMIVVGIKQTNAAPVQPNPNMPNVVVEAAFGATPGDWTQSVDYTWDVQGLTWTDISNRVFSKGDDAVITVKRGRQYELSQEETGEIDIVLDNHDGVFTSGNTASPYYPYVVPGVPIRVTAWFQGVRYPVAFGYVEKWPQQWPDMPQWGFSTITAVDAFGPMASTNLPSAVKGDIKKDSPYFYIPTEEQYSFTQQSLTPVASPIDGNGLLALNYASGNNRYGAYRDGFDQPVTTGQALNLLGDQNTVLGATSYTGQEIGMNGPGMFYFDPNIPTNVNNDSFSVEFWFVWGNSNAFECELLNAFGPPSSFYSTQAIGSITNGAVVTVGINTGVEYASSIPTGFWVNGTEVTQQQFNQNTFSPQHFVLTAGPNGTTCYLNGAATPANPTVPTISQVKAVALGPARFSYDTSGMAVYNGYNFVAGHLAWYGQELTSTMISNHYTSGISGWSGTPAPGRFAQVLTWGGLGLKRGGTAWFNTYGHPEGTYISEAYGYEGSSAADVVSQIVKTEGGRAFIQANGSIVYNYRWNLYNQPSKVTFGDNGTTEIPFEQNTDFSVDNQFIYNVITATQTRGPNQDLFYQLNSSPSENQYFMRSGLSFTDYAMTLFDVFDIVNWGIAKYQQPLQRIANMEIDASKVAGKVAGVFPAILALELNQVVTVNRRPIGGAVFSATGSVQSINHEIGAAHWVTTYQIAPVSPESNALVADSAGNNSPGSSYLSW